MGPQNHNLLCLSDILAQHLPELLKNHFQTLTVKAADLYGHHGNVIVPQQLQARHRLDQRPGTAG